MKDRKMLGQTQADSCSLDEVPQFLPSHSLCVVVSVTFSSFVKQQMVKAGSTALTHKCSPNRTLSLKKKKNYLTSLTDTVVVSG